MRKVIVSEFVSLDGVVEGPGGGEPDYKHAYTEMYYESGPGFVKEHLKRLVAAGIQPHFMIGSINTGLHLGNDSPTAERAVMSADNASEVTS